MALLIGGASALGVTLYSRRQAMVSADAYFGIGLALLELAIMRNVFQNAPTVYLLVTALAAVAFVRVFAEATSGSGAAIRLFQSYVFTGLILGGVLMLIQSALAAGSSSTRKPLGDAAKGLVTLILGVAIVFAAAYFWRQDAISGLLLGAAVGLPMFAVVLVPPFLSATLDLTREQKITVMIWTLAIVAFVVMVTSVLRLRRAR